jgi:hypothetical protein
VRFATLAENEDVAALARRLYRPTTPEGLREAERVLLKANPPLADPARRARGVVVMVPDVTGAGASATDETQSERQLLASVLAAARAQLGEVGQALGAGLASRRADVTATLDRLGSAEMQRLLREEPQLKGVFAGVSREARAETTELDALDRLHRQALGELGQDLDELIRSVGGEPGGGQPIGGRPDRGAPTGTRPTQPGRPATRAGGRPAPSRRRKPR